MSLSRSQRDALQVAMQSHARGELDAARIVYLAVLERAPREPHVLNLLGMLEAQRGQLGDAVVWLRQAAQRAPSDPEILNNLGYALGQLGQVDEAIAAYRRGLAASPGHLKLQLNLGLLLKDTDRDAQALEVFDEALGRHPDQLELLSNRGNVLQKMARHEEALAQYDRALALAPNHLVVLCNRANVLSELGRHAEALACATAATSLEPRHANAWVERGNALVSLGRSTEACESYDQALAIHPEQLNAQINKASLLVGEDRPDAQIIDECLKSLRLAVRLESAGGGPQSLSRLRLTHELQQALHLRKRGQPVAGIDAFIDVATHLLAVDERAASGPIVPSRSERAALQPYLATVHLYAIPALEHCLNPDIDWPAIEAQYLAGEPELVVIDQFLSPQALVHLREFCLSSRVWRGEYGQSYLGAFANQGFASVLHLQLARELRSRMPRVFRDYGLHQLWAFKCDDRSTSGTGVHADFAKVNLNFWITPDEFNLAPEAGGLKVYSEPSPPDWTFTEYNGDAQRIYAFLRERQSASTTIPYRCNRAVLFNSALFHETDTVSFAPGYESRRINTTYLFGRQLGW